MRYISGIGQVFHHWYPWEGTVQLTFRKQALTTDAAGHAVWVTHLSQKVVAPQQTMLVLCDVWDGHWCRGARERLAVLVPRYEQVLHSLRAKGVHIIHSPSEVTDFYLETPARQKMLALPHRQPPHNIDHPDPRLPIDDEDGGADTGEKPWFKAWTRQHARITIDQARDGISEDGDEIYSYYLEKNITQVLFMGIHANMCVLNRPFGIKQLVRWGMPVAFVGDLTDAMYNPAQAPYVSHAEGTRLVVEYIEKFWCPTITSAELL